MEDDSIDMGYLVTRERPVVAVDEARAAFVVGGEREAAGEHRGEVRVGHPGVAPQVGIESIVWKAICRISVSKS